MIRPAAKSREGGFSLPEVTLALGLIASVMISIAGMFIFSGRLVNRGKHMTSAVTIAENVIEETNAWNYVALYERFGLDGSANSYIVDTRSNAFTATWQIEISELLPGDPWAEITLDSVTPAGSPPPLEDAVGIRVGVRVIWQDGERELRLATVRM